MTQVPEIYRDPNRDVAVVDLAPGLKLTVPLSFFSKYGTLQMNLKEVSPVLEELYSLITLVPAQGNPGITLKEAIEFDGR
tara:strand:+ start:961 stop:1200 length:240 start_codon:yes stop_codon:yes gene_type:complete